MKYHLPLLVLVLALLVCDTTFAEKTRKHKKVRRVMKPAVITEDPDVSEMINDEEDVYKVLDKDEQYDRENDRARQSVEIPPEEITDNRVTTDDCSTIHCGAGRVCEVDENGDAQCVCVSVCPVETESRRKVCSNHNETWTSDCSVYQQRCWCDQGDARCKGPEYRHIHIEYYGECRDMPDCSDGEMADFPRRMRDWLFNIMRDLADRQELPQHYLKMEREAESNFTRRWTNAAIWKFCDLDTDIPHDRSVSRHELFPIRAPLMALEHCISPFLNKCDADNNHRITLQEWAKCLEIDEDELDDRCGDI